MGTKAQDPTTQAAASTGAQAQDAQLAANAAKNQAFSDQTRTTLFGTYDPTTNKYAGGTESAYLDPASQNTTSLNGSFANEYNNEANATAKGASDAVGTTMQNLASRGMGSSPAGFAADQERKAYQDQTAQNGNNYSNLFGQQHGEAVANYQNANNMLNSNATGAANLSVQGNTNAASNYGGLYGTASQQKQTGLGAALGAVGGLASAGAQAYAGR
jgi:hypothetical protein